MKKLFYKLWAKFLTQFGAIKIFKFPMFLVYDPSEYEIDGEHMQEALKVLQPGDVILRGYNHYLDGYFVDLFQPNTTKTIIGNGWSHGAIYIGNNKVIHAIAKGVSEINIIDFMKCDRLCIFRPNKYKDEAINIAKNFLKNNIPYDFSYNYGKSALYCYELAALCYPKLQINTFTIKKIFGLIVKNNIYTAKSFINSNDFSIIYCYNKKCNIDFIKQKK